MVLLATRMASTCDQPIGTPLDGADDLVHVDRLKRSVALADMHRRSFLANGKARVSQHRIVCDCGGGHG